MKSCPVNELQHTHVSMKSVRKAQAEALELNPKPMSSRMNKKMKEDSESYRLPDSLCNGAVKPFTMVGPVRPSFAGCRHIGRRDQTPWRTDRGASRSGLLHGVERILDQGRFRSFDETSRALIGFLIQEWENKHEPARFHLYVVGYQSYASLARGQLQIEQTAFFGVPARGYPCGSIRPSCRLISMGSAPR